MARTMSTDHPYRAVVLYDYTPPNSGTLIEMESVFGPYENKVTAKSQGKQKAKKFSELYSNGGVNFRYKVQECAGWNDIEEHYV